MKALKYIFILLLVLIIAGAVYFSLQDGSYETESKQLVEAPVDLVYSELADFSNWEKWYERAQNEDYSASLSNQTAGVDAVYTYNSDDGNGTITVERLDPNKSIEYAINHDGRLGKREATLSIDLQKQEIGTLVTSAIKGDQDLGSKIFTTLTGADLANNWENNITATVENMESVLEEKMNLKTINVDGLIQYSGGYYLYMSSSSTMANFSNLQSQMTQQIRSFMQANNIDTYGAPMVIYEKFDEPRENVIFSAAIPVQNRILTGVDSKILCGFMEPGSAVKVTLKGKYKYLEEAWNKAENYIVVNGLEKSEVPPYEVYKTDPYKTPNPANYLTEIYIPIK
ncbi:GyrI-like domain-containing protein [Nonlabens ponticola]|uniref:AraC effector-binding domain-containing protein n=1 Tax=Nonlabens ponticola TaxID=2496866 RepID=A0A3S9MZL5_9FLAO|nr:GyrI-like domain-containing protein [Nonlabens ponticola]AZQ44607.1 hypothetical protein EJ995_10255 [Nonlabens ponticola]